MIYTEGSVADKFYIIYEGRFILKKDNSNRNNEKFFYCKNDVANHSVVWNLTTGGFAGLEAFLNYDISYIEREIISNNGLKNDINEKEKSHMKQRSLLDLKVNLPAEKIKYKNSLIADSENNMVFSIDPNLLGRNSRNNLFEFFKPILEQREKFISEIFENQQKIREKMKCNYRENIISDMTKNKRKQLMENIDQIGENDNYLAIVRPPLEKIKKSNELKVQQTNIPNINSNSNKPGFFSSKYSTLPEKVSKRINSIFSMNKNIEKSFFTNLYSDTTMENEVGSYSMKKI